MTAAAALDSAGVSGKFNTQPLLSLLRATDEQVADLRYRGLPLPLPLPRPLPLPLPLPLPQTLTLTLNLTLTLTLTLTFLAGWGCFPCAFLTGHSGMGIISTDVQWALFVLGDQP